MEAHKGDRLVIEGNKLGQMRRSGKVTRADGPPDHQRLWVHWDDGHDSMFMPGSGVKVERPRK